MKRIFIFVCVMTCATLVATAQTSTEILRKVSSTIDALGSYTADFVMSSLEGQATGSYVVSGSKFRIDGNAVELVCDGRTVWEIDHAAKEISVDNAGYDATIWSNPAKAFSMLDTRFEHKLLGHETTAGKNLYCIRLTSQQQTLDSFTLLVDSTTSLPYKAIYGEGEHEVSIRFVRIRSGEPESVSFGVEAADFADYEIIDLR